MNSFSACLAKNEEYSVPCSPSSTNSSPTTTTKEPGPAGRPTTGVGSLNHHPPHSSTKPHCNTTTTHYPHHRGNQARNSVGASSSHLSGITAAVFFPAYHNMDQNMDYYPTGSVAGQTLADPTNPLPPPPPQAVKKEKSPSLTIDRAAFLLLRVKKAFKRKRQQRKEKQ